jgi:DNA-binding transcriptional regulator YhcF (GntR family)
MQTIGDSQVIKSGPRYQRAMKSIAESIALGRYAPGQKLPGLKELSRDLGMNYLTVRRALLELAEKGMVDIRHGVGTFVQERTNHTYEKCLKLALAIRSCMLNIDKNHPVVGAYLAGAYQCCQNKHCRVQSLVFDEGRFTEQLKRMITEESLDGIVVTTRCNE